MFGGTIQSFKTAVTRSPSVSRTNTIHYLMREDANISIEGRHLRKSNKVIV